MDIKENRINNFNQMTFCEKRIHPEEKLLRNRGFVLGKKLDSGTFSTVRLAERITSSCNSKMAVKIINRSKALKVFVEKFLPRELQILSSLKHHNIVQVYSIFHLKENTYIFMEYAPNGDITTYVQNNGALSESLAKKWFVQILEALRYCHRKDIAHRDLKCDNILLDIYMNAKLADFGFARHCTDLATQKQIFSETYCGSVAYVAPEVIIGKPYDPKLSDIWSLGICLYVMMNNAMPFNDKNVKKMLRNQIANKWQFRSNLNLSINVKELIKSILQPYSIRRPSLRTIAHHPWIIENIHSGHA
ncbi:testis-specific serine/threonine-protein kinase 3-like [Centruroides sculpturatus]|uniref:testis-specific serine/threonine-protein kinase 3-like n=1 Tax=Centruroides sculpturatus TaxID=218467 RepID=UPI000C6CD23D|nr:testis-specific serine/threonine-protein kinase 3-like [Centruroides sculpturatus]